MIGNYRTQVPSPSRPNEEISLLSLSGLSVVAGFKPNTEDAEKKTDKNSMICQIKIIGNDQTSGSSPNETLKNLMITNIPLRFFYCLTKPPLIMSRSKIVSHSNKSISGQNFILFTNSDQQYELFGSLYLQEDVLKAKRECDVNQRKQPDQELVQYIHSH